MRLLKTAVLGFSLAAVSAGAAAQTGPASTQRTEEQQAEEIVVTAQRSGIPVWRVKGAGSTIVLVGTIDNVAKETRWDPAALSAALLQADKVMFPTSGSVSISSPFAAISYLARLNKMRSLPKGQTLAQMTTPAQFARLTALRDRGVLKPGFERTHPLFVAYSLGETARGKTGYGPDASSYVRRTIKKNKIKMVPTLGFKAKPVVDDLTRSAPQTHIPCLMSAVALVEAGPGAIKAHSDAWAARRVADVLNSPAQKIERACWPSNSVFEKQVTAGLKPTIRRLLAEPRSTVAVMSLYALARPGGVLDDLKAAGFDVRGPRW